MRRPIPCSLRVVWAASAFALAMGAFPRPAACATEALQMVSGQQRVLSAPGVTRIAIANPNVADVKVVGSGEVLVTAVGDGQTELTIWRGNRISKYEITVSTMDPRELRREVQHLLGDREGISVHIVRNQVNIEGRVLTLSDLEKAEEVAKRYPQVHNLVKLDPSAHAHIAEAINRQLSSVGLKNARATVVGSTIFLEGIVDSEADLKKAQIITNSMGNNIQSVLRVAPSQMIELDVEFVEVAKNSLDQIGFNWPTDIKGEVSLNYARADVFKGPLPNTDTLNSTGNASASLGLALQFNDGHTRLLARPRLITASGQEAKFLVGGEVPIPVVTQNTSYVEYKPYGIHLKITPTADPNGTIETKVLAEISDVDQSVSVNGIPGFLTRRVDTNVTVHDGQTIVLSGLLQLQEGKDVTKVPILGHIPIIGELFKSREFRERRTELAIFVTPRRVDPVSKHLQELSREILKAYRDAKSDIGFSLFD